MGEIEEITVFLNTDMVNVFLNTDMVNEIQKAVDAERIKYANGLVTHRDYLVRVTTIIDGAVNTFMDHIKNASYANDYEKANRLLRGYSSVDIFINKIKIKI